MTCCIDQVILRASRVMMSSPNEPESCLYAY